MKDPHPAHSVEELCAAGSELYERALREGRIHSEDAEVAPCLVDFGLLQPAVEDPVRLEPVAPVVALHRLLRRSGERIADERWREARLAAVFEPLMRVDGRRTATADTPMINVLSGSKQINQAITEAMAHASRELLTVQPHTHTGERRYQAEAIALDRDQALLDRGARIRTLYQHTVRHSPTVLARYEQLKGDIETRSLDEVTDRLIVTDRTVAFIPADKDGSLALEVRHRPSSVTSSPPSTGSGAWPRPCIPKPSDVPRSKASPHVSEPSPPFSSKATPTRPSPNGSA
ncbi:hypothetical protein GCM10010372_33640 [Streptomyces tauricus]|nr:hypothetical protein GCM10010372_33640 [Streptomyces tauricus]